MRILRQVTTLQRELVGLVGQPKETSSVRQSPKSKRKSKPAPIALDSTPGGGGGGPADDATWLRSMSGDGEEVPSGKRLTENDENYIEPLSPIL